MRGLSSNLQLPAQFEGSEMDLSTHIADWELAQPFRISNI